MKWMLLTIGFLCVAMASTLAVLAKVINERDDARDMCALLMSRNSRKGKK